MMLKCRTVAILGMPGVQLLDVSGPMDVFAEANVQAGRVAYRLIVGACGPGPLVSSSGLRLTRDFVAGPDVDETAGGAAEGAIDTLLVAGCPNATATTLDAGVLDW